MTTISDQDRAEARRRHSGVRQWLAIRDHVLAAHKCPATPVWRPVTRDEIQEGWEVRSRRPDGSEAVWGTAHHQDDDGGWRTEAGRRLTHDTSCRSWTYETTAPLP